MGYGYKRVATTTLRDVTQCGTITMRRGKGDINRGNLYLVHSSHF